MHRHRAAAARPEQRRFDADLKHVNIRHQASESSPEGPEEPCISWLSLRISSGVIRSNIILVPLAPVLREAKQCQGDRQTEDCLASKASRTVAPVAVSMISFMDKTPPDEVCAR